VPANSKILQASKRLNRVIKLRICKLFQEIILLHLILMSLHKLIDINGRRLFSPTTGYYISKIYTAKRWGLSKILDGWSSWRKLGGDLAELKGDFSANGLAYLCGSLRHFKLKFLSFLVYNRYQRSLFQINIFDNHISYLISEPSFLTGV
jgi:hypothetical protein